jgi:hypothetical protein
MAACTHPRQYRLQENWTKRTAGALERCTLTSLDDTAIALFSRECHTRLTFN